MDGRGGAWNTSSGRRSVSYVVISTQASAPTREEEKGTRTSEARCIESGDSAQHLLDARAEAAYAGGAVGAEGGLGMGNGVPRGREVEEDGVGVRGGGEAVAADVAVGEGHGGQPVARELGAGGAEARLVELEGEEAPSGPDGARDGVREGGGAGACDGGQREARA